MTTSSDHQAEIISTDNLPYAFTSALPKARAAIFWERAYPRLVPPGVVTGLFASASFAGVWGMASPTQRMIGVAVCAAALALSLICPPRAFRTGSWRVTPEEAAKRLDTNSGMPFKRAELFLDKPATDAPKDIAQFNLHMNSVWEKYAGPFIVGTPKPEMAKRDPLRLHIATALLTAATAIYAKAPHTDLIVQAFDWGTDASKTATQAEAKGLRIKAWVQPPEGIDIRPLELNESSTDKDMHGIALQAHEGSTLTIMTYNKKPIIKVNGAAWDMKQEISIGEDNKSYQFEIPLTAGKNEITIEDGPTWTIDTREDLPPSITILGINEKAQRGRKSMDVDYQAQDDYGCQGEVMLTPSRKPAGGAASLPSAQMPPLPVPCVK